MSTTVTSTLDIVLKDDVSKSAAQVSAALQKLEAREKEISAALGKSGVTDKFASSLKAIGAEVPHIEAAGKAWAQYAKEQGLAAESSQWTKADLAGIKNWESTKKAQIRSVMSAERAMAEQHTRMAVKMEAEAHRANSHGGGGMLGGIVAMLAEEKIVEFAKSSIEKYADYDKERRYQKVIMGISDDEQKPLLDQAMKIGTSSRFNQSQIMEGQRDFAARGYNTERVLAFTPVAAKLAQSLDTALPDAVKLLEGALQGFGKDTSTYAKAAAAAGRTADLEVKASKISGMSPEDIKFIYAYGAAATRMSGLREENMLAFAALGKKNNLGGEESGTAWRALVKNLLAPTHEGLTALRANGIDYNQFKTPPKALDMAALQADVASKYGVVLKAGTVGALKRIASNPEMLADTAKFMPAVMGALRATLGKQDAKSMKSIAGDLGNFLRDSAGGVRANDLLAAFMSAAQKNPGLWNSVFGSKMGSKIAAILSTPGAYDKIVGELDTESQGFNDKVSAARNEGFSAAEGRIGASVSALETAISNSFDNGGRGGGGALTGATDAIGRFIAALAGADPIILRAGSELGALAAAAAAFKGFSWLVGGKAGLAELFSLGLEGATISVGTMAIGAIGLAAIIEAMSHGEKKHRASDDPDFGKDYALPFSPLTGVPDTSAQPAGTPRGSVHSQDKTSLPGEWIIGRGGVREWSAFDLKPRALPRLTNGMLAHPFDVDSLEGGYGAGIWPTKPQPNPFFRPVPYSESTSFPEIDEGPGVHVIQGGAGYYPDPMGREQERGAAMSQHLDEVKVKAGEAHAALDGLNTTVTPNVSMAALDALIARIAEARRALASLGGVASVGVGPSGSSPRGFHSASAGSGGRLTG